IDRSVRVVYALRVAGGARRVTHRRGLVLVVHLQRELLRLPGEQVLVTVHGHPGRRQLRDVTRSDDDQVFYGGHLLQQGRQGSQKGHVGGDDLIGGVVDDVGDLLG